MNLSNRNEIAVPGDWLQTSPYQTVPEDLYYYVEHLKRVWPERQRFSVRHSVPLQMRYKSPAVFLESIDDSLRHRMYEGARERHHMVISSQKPVWVEDRDNGSYMCIRLVQGVSIPATSGVSFL